MTYSRNRYDQDFKKNAVRLSFNSSKPVKIIASELGVPESALYRWRKLYTEDGKQTPFASLEAENRALKRENAELALERDMTNCQLKCNFLPMKTSDGVFQPKTLRGRLFSCSM